MGKKRDISLYKKRYRPMAGYFSFDSVDFFTFSDADPLSVLVLEFVLLCLPFPFEGELLFLFL